MWEAAQGAEGIGREKPWNGGRKDTGQGRDGARARKDGARARRGLGEEGALGKGQEAQEGREAGDRPQVELQGGFNASHCFSFTRICHLECCKAL